MTYIYLDFAGPRAPRMCGLATGEGRQQSACLSVQIERHVLHNLLQSAGRHTVQQSTACLPSRSRSESPPSRQSAWAAVGEKLSRTYVTTPACGVHLCGHRQQQLVAPSPHGLGCSVACQRRSKRRSQAVQLQQDISNSVCCTRICVRCAHECSTLFHHMQPPLLALNPRRLLPAGAFAAAEPCKQRSRQPRVFQTLIWQGLRTAVAFLLARHGPEGLRTQLFSVTAAWERA